MRKIIVQYSLDRGRIYLTGLSSGGAGTWAIAVKHPEFFAALAPVCVDIPDVPQFMEKLKNLRSVPIWVYYGANGTITPVKTAIRQWHY